MQSSGEVPQALKDKPTLHPWLGMYYEAFVTLVNTRPIYQGGFGHIPFSEITSMATECGQTDEEDRALFITMITALDRAYVAYVNEKVSNETKAQNRAGNKDIIVPNRARTRER